MTRLFIGCLYLACLLVTQNAASQVKPDWTRVDIGIIGTASQDILKSAFEQAKGQSHGGILIVLDTPGGALDATRAMVKDIMNSDIPVIVWVGPDGSRAGSAGAFITLAADVAAMAPGTNIGAAHPIQANGKNVEDDARKKIEEDTVAFMESIAQRRGRNIEMARSFVVTSASITAEEALEHKVIDLIASDVNDLLKQVSNMEVSQAEGKKQKMDTDGIRLVNYEKSLKQEFLEIVSNPNLFYLLFLAGIIGLGFELTHPGSFVPGVIGGICMILALIATSVLPISFGAMLLLLAGIALMVAESFVPSFGILGIGGFVAFVIGSFLLVDPGNEQGLRISWLTIAPGALTIAGAATGIAYLVLRAERSSVKAGPETLIKDVGTAIADFDGIHGRIRIEGEDWLAELNDASEAVRRGDRVVVDRVEGLKLFVSLEKGGHNG